MNAERSIDDIVADWNAKANAEGIFDGRAFWEVPREPGSVFDVPETPESRDRVAWLQRTIEEMKNSRRATAAVDTEMHHVRAHVLDAVSPDATMPEEAEA